MSFNNQKTNTVSPQGNSRVNVCLSSCPYSRLISCLYMFSPEGVFLLSGLNTWQPLIFLLTLPVSLSSINSPFIEGQLCSCFAVTHTDCTVLKSVNICSVVQGLQAAAAAAAAAGFYVTEKS